MWHTIAQFSSGGLHIYTIRRSLKYQVSDTSK